VKCHRTVGLSVRRRATCCIYAVAIVTTLQPVNIGGRVYVRVRVTVTVRVSVRVIFSIT